MFFMNKGLEEKINSLERVVNSYREETTELKNAVLLCLKHIQKLCELQEINRSRTISL